MGEYTALKLPYGKGYKTIRIPTGNLKQVLALKPKPPVDSESLIKYTLRNPVGSPPLHKLVKNRSWKICVVTSDRTRPMPSRVTLPRLLEEIKLAGVPNDNVTILIATGLHEPDSPEELKERLGEEIVEQYQIINHRAEDSSRTFIWELCQLGHPYTLIGLPLRLIS